MFQYLFYTLFTYITLYIKISAHAYGGPRSRICARETLRSAPYWGERKFSVAHVCRIALNHLPPTA